VNGNGAGGEQEPMSPSKTIRHAQPNRGLLSALPEEVMPDHHLRVRCDPVQRCGTNNFEREGSVLDWRQAMPVGNGDLGAAIHGYPDNYTLHIAKNDVWWDDREEGTDPFPPMTFQELRRRVEVGDPEVKRDIRAAAAANLRWDPTPTGCARLTLHVCRAATFYNVKEYVNLTNATASTEFCVSQAGVQDGGPYWSQTFAARLEEVLVVRLRPPPEPNNLGTVQFELGRDPLEMTAVSRRRMTQAEFAEAFRPRASTDGGLGWFTMPLSGGGHYTVMIGCDSRGLSLSTDGEAVRGRGRPADGALAFVVAVVSSNDSDDTVAEARRRVGRALAIGAETMWGEHGQWWNRYWRRSWVALPKGCSERSWYWGLYKAGSARRPGRVCPGYGAPWRKGNYLNWGSITIGYEETKYNLGLLPTNHAELLEPWIATVRRAAEGCREVVKRFYDGMPGIAFPFGFTWRGAPVGYSPLYNSTPLCVYTAGEAVKCAWDYYDFTGDGEFLARVGYPLLKGVAAFYRAYLQEGTDGRLHVFPSRYWEYDSWCETLDDFMRDSVPDLAVFRFVLTHAARAAQALGSDTAEAADWLDAAARLPEYATWPDGTVKPSADWVERGRLTFVPSRDLIDLWPVSATGEVDAWSGPEARREAFRRTYARALGQHPLDTWDRCFPFIAAARMGDRDYAGKILRHLQNVPEAGNLNRGDPADAPGADGHSPFVVDAGSAFPSEVMTEFLLQSHGGLIRLFPAAPRQGHFAFHSLRARGAFLVSSEFRDGQVPYALVQSLRGNPCRVAQPFEDGATVRVRDLDRPAVVVSGRAPADGAIEFSTESGHLYVIERGECPLEEIPVLTI